MNVKSGDRAVIIKSALGVNIGRVIDVGEYRGEHTQYGPIWHVYSTGSALVTEYGGIGKECDCADDWLRPLLPEADVKAMDRELEAA